MESAEVNKMDLLRTVDGTVIYEDSNSQPQNQVRILICFGVVPLAELVLDFFQLGFLVVMSSS